MKTKDNINLWSNILTISGIIAVCFWIIIESVKMSKEAIENGTAKLYSAPGLLPFVIAFFTIILSVFILIHYSKKRPNKKIKLKQLYESLKNPLIVFGLLFLYIYILIPKVPFVISTIIFTSLIMTVFNAASILKIIIISLIYSLMVVYFFIKVVGVNFPYSLFNFS